MNSYGRWRKRQFYWALAGLPGDLHAGTGWLETAPESPPRSGGARPSDPAGDSGDPTGIWWPYAAGAVAVVGGILVTVWPHLPR